MSSTRARLAVLVAAVGIVTACGGGPPADPGGTGIDRGNRGEFLQASGARWIGAGGDTVLASGGCNGGMLEAGIHRSTMGFDGWQRNYIVAVPGDDREPVPPLLLAMHGYGGSAGGMRYMMQQNSGAEDGWVVVYPDGAGSQDRRRGWNSGHPACCGTALDEDVDDVAFLSALIDAVGAATCVDLSRVYATGFSNGGDMAQRLACDAADYVAAVASFAGRFDYHAETCPGARAVPTTLYRGAEDTVVPYDRDHARLMSIRTVPALEGFDQIARNHACVGEPSRSLVADNTECLTFDACDGDYELSLCTSIDHGHCWPGMGGCTWRAGADTIDATSAIDHLKQFFLRHRLPETHLPAT